MNHCLKGIFALSLLLLVSPVKADGTHTALPQLNILLEPQHPDMARLLQLARKQDAAAEFQLGLIHYYGLHSPDNPLLGLEHFKRASDLGHGEADTYLASEAMDARYTPINLKVHKRHIDRAAKFYGLSKEDMAGAYIVTLAEAGSAYAQWSVGSRSRDEEANRMVRKAAEQDQPMAIVRLGNDLLTGNGIEANPAEGEALLIKSAEQGMLSTQIQLSLGYRDGKYGLPKDPVKAERWLKITANRGDVLLQESYAELLLEGMYGEDRKPEAIEWFHKSANQGSKSSQFMMGKIHVDGDLVPQDLVIAYSWLDLASERSDDAADLLAEIEPDMSETEISKGKARSQELAVNIRKYIARR